MDVRLKRHFEVWISFFVEGVIESFLHALKTIESLLNLKQNHLKLLHKLQGKTKQTAILLFTYLESHRYETNKHWDWKSV